MRRNRLVTLGVLLLCVLSSFALGYAFGKDYVEPPEWARDARDGVLGWFASDAAPPEPEPAVGPEDVGSVRLASTFFPVVGSWGAVPAERDGAGGGLTSLGPDVLVLTFEGRIFAASSPESLRETSIRPPDNGYAALASAVRDRRYPDLRFDFGHFRYNDILHVRSDDLHGLAISYTDWDAGRECYANSIALLSLPDSVTTVEEVSASPDDWRLLFSSEPCLPLKAEFRAIEGHMAGGRMAFAPPHTLYFGSGDYHWDGMYAPRVLAQDPDNDYGKVIAIDLRSGRHRVVSRGHRNVQGILEADGEVWVVEQGPRGGDELNRVREGANFGWPRAALGTQYSRLPLLGLEAPVGRHDGFVRPVYAWLPSVATSSLTRVDGFHGAWDGDLLAGTLKRQALFRLRVVEGRVLFAEEIRVDERVRDAHQHTDGRLVLWTDSERLMFLEPASRGYSMELFEDFVENTRLDSVGRRRLRTAMTGCLECHGLEPQEGPGAPPLGRVYGSPIGGTDYPGYSRALRAMEGAWSRERLLRYLADPSGFAPGTTMPDPAIREPRIRAALVSFLDTLKNTRED